MNSFKEFNEAYASKVSSKILRLLEDFLETIESGVDVTPESAASTRKVFLDDLGFSVQTAHKESEGKSVTIVALAGEIRRQFEAMPVGKRASILSKFADVLDAARKDN